MGADAIVVLGCAVRGNEPSPALRRRVECGVACFRRGDAPILLLCGGGPGARPEAEIMQEIALASGVPIAAILLEPRSSNTFENAAEAARLMRAKGLASVVLVSDRYHLPRAALLFRRAGLAVRVTDHPPSRGLWRELPLMARETLAFALGVLRLLRGGRELRRSS
jgi:uncharacterized SAM-binding protein YcdF (DUF218 family)